jgi:hypothetical protein
LSELGDACFPRRAFQLGREIVDAEIIGRRSGCEIAGLQQPLMVERRQQRATILECAQPVEAHCIKPLEDVEVLAMLGSPAVLLDEPLDLLKAGNDSLVARGAPDRLRWLGEVGELVAQLVEVEVTHSDPRP